MPTAAKKRTIVRSVLALMALMAALSASLLVPQTVHADDGGYPYAAYDGPGSNPSTWTWTDANGNMWSPYHYAFRNCTDFVAWKLDAANNWNPNVSMGNADSWKSWASNVNHAYTVNTTPAVGAVAWWGDHTWNGNYGHVAYVTAVNSDGSANISEYNFTNPGAYDTRTSIKADNYIHFSDLSSSSTPTPTPPPYKGRFLG